MILKVVLVLFLSGVCSLSIAKEAGQEHEHESVFTPEEEAEWNQLISPLGFRFPQTKWRECQDHIMGNYTGFNCTNRRNISVILKDYLLRNIETCSEEALKAIGVSQRVVDTHITHVGIQGDPNHSPRSLHSESRAIDIKSIELALRNRTSRKFTFSRASNDPFYNSFRQCWGRKINRENGCPLISQSRLLTGSIGKEDPDHRRHLHLSVPYCKNGRYSSNYFRR